MKRLVVTHLLALAVGWVLATITTTWRQLDDAIGLASIALGDAPPLDDADVRRIVDRVAQSRAADDDHAWDMACLYEGRTLEPWELPSWRIR